MMLDPDLQEQGAACLALWVWGAGAGGVTQGWWVGALGDYAAQQGEDNAWT